MIQKICQIKAKDSEKKDYSLCLGNISKDFTINNAKKTWLKGSVKFFSVDFNPIDNHKIFHIHRYSMKETYYKTMFGIIKINLYCIINYHS